MILDATSSLEQQRLGQRYEQLLVAYRELESRYLKLREDAAAQIQQLYTEQQELRAALQEQLKTGEQND